MSRAAIDLQKLESQRLMALRINRLELSHFEWLSRIRDGAGAGGWRGPGFGQPALATFLILDNHSKRLNSKRFMRNAINLWLSSFWRLIAARLENNLKILQRLLRYCLLPKNCKLSLHKMAIVSFYPRKGKFYPRGEKWPLLNENSLSKNIKI